MAAPAAPRGLIAIDLDGTLLGPDGELSTRAADAVRAVAAAGWCVVFATGRPPHVVAPLASELAGAVSYVVATNGSMLCTFPATPDEQPQLLDMSSFDLATARTIVAELRRTDPDFAFALATDHGFAHEHGFAERMPAHVPDPPVDDVLDLGGTLAFKLFAFHPTRTAHDLVAELPATVRGIVERAHPGDAGAGDAGEGDAGDEFTVSHMGADAVEIGPGRIDKAAGVSALCARLGVAAADVVAFGDEWNDITMLRWAGRGIAVANAVDEVRAAADEITAANTDDGVAQVLERLAT